MPYFFLPHLVLDLDGSRFKSVIHKWNVFLSFSASSFIFSTNVVINIPLKFHIFPLAILTWIAPSGSWFVFYDSWYLLRWCNKKSATITRLRHIGTVSIFLSSRSQRTVTRLGAVCKLSTGPVLLRPRRITIKLVVTQHLLVNCISTRLSGREFQSYFTTSLSRP